MQYGKFDILYSIIDNAVVDTHHGPKFTLRLDFTRTRSIFKSDDLALLKSNKLGKKLYIWWSGY